MSRKLIDNKYSYCQSNPSDDNQQVFKEWDALSSRLSEVQKKLMVVNKRQLKLQKKFNKHVQQTIRINIDHDEELSILNQQRKNRQFDLQQMCDQLTNMKKEISDQINYKIQKQINGINLDNFQISQIIQKKTQNLFSQTKSYVDRAVYQLKQLLKKYVKQQGQIQKKIVNKSKQRAFESPKRSLGSTMSAKKFKFETENTKEVQQLESRSITQKQPSVSTSRVSYLKQKLKQFEKINKKYDNFQQSVKVQPKRDEQMVQKMKNYRDFLEQSDSELDQSNINYMKQAEKDRVFIKSNQKNRIFLK